MARSSSWVRPTVRNWSRARFGQHAQRPVPGVNQVSGLLNDPAQHHRQVELGVEDEDRLHQPAQLGGIVDPVDGLHGTSG